MCYLPLIYNIDLGLQELQLGTGPTLWHAHVIKYLHVWTRNQIGGSWFDMMGSQRLLIDIDWRIHHYQGWGCQYGIIVLSLSK